MRYRIDTGQPDPGKKRGFAGQTKPQKEIKHRKYAISGVKDKPADRCIEGYLGFLDREIAALNAGLIGQHYRHCAEMFYREFKSSQSIQDRFRAWLAIRTCCQWLSQLGRYK